MEPKTRISPPASTPRALTFCVLAAGLAGCVITTQNPGHERTVMTQEEFAAYVERVFRYHNQVMNDLIEAAEDRSEQDKKEAQDLSAAEARMIRTCQPLNDVVSESLTGKSLGLQTELELAETVPACEEASQAVDDLIP